MKKTFWLWIPLIALACKDPNNEKTINNNNTETKIEINKVGPSFNASNAFNNIKTQVDFGPRVPGTAAHKQTADWLRDELKKSADTVIVQHTTLTLADKKTKVPCYNVIGSFNPTASRRFLLLAHWDTRPWADQGFSNQDKPIPGADDGGSGTGILIEIARLLKAQKLPADIGVDIVLVDVEDYAKSEWGDDAYALGTQYWAKNPHVKDYKAEAGILLDMVGGREARFAIEANSKDYGNHIITDIWGIANDLGYGKYFVYEQSGAYISDDHVPVNEILKIPTIDIINLPKGSKTGFVAYWHTHEDNMNNIDIATLEAVGQTLIQYLYTRSKPAV